MNSISRAVLAVVVFAIPALGQQTPLKGQMTMAPLPYDEKGLWERLHEDNQREIELGKWVKDNAQMQQTKDVAEMMIREHEQLDRDIMAHAKKQNLKLGKVNLVDDKERKQKAHVDAATNYIRSLDGLAIDSVYLANMVIDHDQALLLVTRGIQKFNTGGAAELLRRVQPGLQQHRDHVYRALGEVRIPSELGVGGAGTEGQHDWQMKQKQEKKGY